MNFSESMRVKAEQVIIQVEQLECLSADKLRSVVVKPTLLTPDLIKMLRLKVSLLKEIEKAALFCIRTSQPITKEELDSVSSFILSQEQQRTPLFLAFWELVKSNGAVDALANEKV